MDRSELVDENAADDSSLLQVREAIERNLPQRAVRLYPGSDGSPKPCFVCEESPRAKACNACLKK